MLVQMLPDDLLTWPLLDVLVIVILSPSIMMIFIYISWRVRQRQRRQKDLAPQNVVTNLPVKVFRQVERKENEPEECAICLEDYVDGEELRILPCRHEFHVGCVDAWLTTRKKFVSPFSTALEIHPFARHTECICYSVLFAREMSWTTIPLRLRPCWMFDSDLLH